MKLEQLKINVKQWSQERGILEHSTYEKQIEKFFSERAELFTTDDAEDAYGDQMVCLINAFFLCRDDVIKTDFVDNEFASKVEIMLSIVCVGGAIAALENEIEHCALTPETCYQKAWDAIKHRVGIMVNGKFVKWDNLTHEQCIEVARSGQLMKPDVDLDHCKSFCSDEQWWQIREAERISHDI